MVTDDRAWELLTDAVDRIEEKTDKINTKMNTMCEALGSVRATVKSHAIGLRIIVGFGVAVAIALAVAWVRNGG